MGKEAVVNKLMWAVAVAVGVGVKVGKGVAVTSITRRHPILESGLSIMALLRNAERTNWEV